jgi:hypothetical protein
VREPCGTDGQEAHHVRQIEGPGIDYAVQRGARTGNGQVEDQQGDGDGEHAIAERLQPGLAKDGVWLGGVLLTGQADTSSNCGGATYMS